MLCHSRFAEPSAIIANSLRPALFLVLVLFVSPALAQDARVSFLAKQLKAAKDPRVRAQTVVILAGTGSPAAVAPLCEAMQDQEVVVRAAAANALGELHLPEGITCLKAALGERDPSVRAAIQRAIDFKPVVPGGLYFAIDPINDKVGVTPDVAQLANDLLKQKLTSIGATFAPQGESKPQAATLIKAKKLRGFLLRVNLLPNASNGLKLEILVMTYPEQSLQGSWNVKASGAKHESLLKAMVPRVIDDASADLEWKGQ
ncbi:MAG: cpcE [Myxococcaceae bacterium]|nr:cpcE [Myxococcaceae bacterium]